MYRFLQFRADKGDAWRLYTEEQILGGELPSPPTFQTVLFIDQDPEAVIEQELDPLDTVHYYGPMYLDFDDREDIDNVIQEVNLVLDYLMNKLDIPTDYIHCWLSGGKGVHITIPGEIFGLKKPTKFLPMVYREIMLTIMAQAGLESPCTLDESVYSCGRGRMWRTEGMARPGTGTFKVATTPNELAHMDSDEYHHLVADARPPLATPSPAKSLSFPKAEHLFKQAKISATRKVKAMKEACVVPKELLREWEGIPGCVQTLITEGDCDGSNWNQGAMQLATYIAAKYEQSESAEYMEQLVKPFATNVENGDRGSVQERIKHVKQQLARAFRGSTKFAPGAFIAAIGKPCRACPICRSDLAKGEVSQEEGGLDQFDPDMKIRYDVAGYHLVAENGSRRLTNFTYWPELEVFELEPVTLADGSQGWKHSERKELRGTLLVEGGIVHRDVPVSERNWGSKRDLISSFKGRDAAILGGDAEAQKLLLSILKFARERAEDKELEKMVRANVCGIIMDRNGKSVVAHYVEAGSSITAMGARSPYRFYGPPQQSPSLIGGRNPLENDDDLEIAITAMCQVNEPVQVALIMGWMVACHFREHIQFDEQQFPLMNIYGNAGAGKSCLAVLFCKLCGIDYSRAEFMNVEVGTMYPLVKYLSSSTTVPRYVDEVNPVMLGQTKYNAVLGLFKAGWGRAPVPRGRISADKELGVTDDRISAPIVYTSEQSATLPALRSRSVEVRLQAKTLLNKAHKEAYKTAVAKSSALPRLAKALVQVAMNTSPKALLEIFHGKDDEVHGSLEERKRWGFKTCLTGLHMLMHTMDEYEVGAKQHVQELYDSLVKHLGGRVMEVDRGQSSSEVDRVLAAMNMQADDTFPESYRLMPGKHYWKAGDSLYLNLQSCLPRYLVYAKHSGEQAVIRQYHQMVELLEGEVYYERTEPHPSRERCEVFVINIPKLEEKGTLLNNFIDSDAD
ncbi:hypothetical protein uan_098 [Pseudomonas phage UAntarctica]|nr:hypothetical protein uan_098 [Pseudomonas phage UAntarctica]